ncbi:nuclear transport factor 2 family protein [Catenulispora sp. NL8]|uniref:Nuclear transport factor 2 family protein n=1 Tax=Catenulispora pinistramenti TaxID=2705254 RepID=A0ABS5KMZ7_9ACTN|nr:nuclear transport factor 2 family protein [Catenulispora pinistramenti]MBS2547400.1 nuclear transport factor 2 family protein [Catenulispora pinistramenti]
MHVHLEALLNSERAVADRFALDDLLTAYAVAIDTDQVTELTRLATADAVFDYQSSGGPRGSVADAQQWLEKSLQLVPVRAHLIVNRRFDIHGDTAVAEAHFFNPMSVRIPGQKGDMWNPGGGYYSVNFRRTDKGWRISELVMLQTWRVAVAVHTAGKAGDGHHAS